MKRLFIILLVLLVPLAYAEMISNSEMRIEYTLKPSYNKSGVVAVLNPIAQNHTKGILYQHGITTVVVVTGGGGGGGAVTDKFVIKVETIGKYFRPDDNIRARVYIYNLDQYNQSGITLKTYFESPDGTQTESKYYKLPEITPACLKGSYRLGFNDCRYNLDLFTAFPYEYLVNMSLPTQANKGDWKFYVELQPPNASYLKTFVNFRVLSLLNYFLILLVIISVLIFLIAKRRKKQRMMKYAQNKGKVTQAKDKQ